MKKKLFIGIAALCFVFLAPFLTAASTACAEEEIQQEEEYYIYNYGDREIYYLMDEKMQPYYEANGERIYLALPLEHLRVTDEEFLAELNRGMQTAMAINPLAYVPGDYHDLAVETFERTMYLSDNYTYTGILKMDPTKRVIIMKTSEEIKNHLFTGKKISYIVAYYSVVDESWHKQTVEDINCSNDVGVSLNVVSGQLSPYVYFGVKKSSDLYSAKVSCWCTDI